MTSFKKLQEAYKKSCGCEEKEIDEEGLKDACWKGYEAIGTKKKNGREVPNCVPVKEESEQEKAKKELDLKLSKWKNQQRAAKALGEAEEKDDPPFTPDPPKKNPSAKAGKYGLGHSIAKHLARQAMKNLTKGKDTNENFASDAQRKAVWASKNEKGVKEELDEMTRDEWDKQAEMTRKISDKHASEKTIHDALSSDYHEHRRLAAEHPKANSEHLHRALKDESRHTREAAIRNPNATPEHIHKGLDDKEVWNRMKAAKHPNASKENLDKALRDKDRTVRANAAGHPNATSEHLHKAMDDNHSEVKLAAVKNPNATKEHLAKAVHSHSIEVRQAARKHPNHPDNKLKEEVELDEAKTTHSIYNVGVTTTGSHGEREGRLYRVTVKRGDDEESRVKSVVAKHHGDQKHEITSMKKGQFNRKQPNLNKGISEEVEVSEEYHVVANKSYYGDKSTPVKVSSHKTKDEADAALAKHKANKSGSERWHKTVDSAGLKKHMNEDISIDEAYKLPSDSDIDKVKAHVKANHPNKSLTQVAVHKQTKKIEYVVKDKDGKMSGHTLGEEAEQIDEISKDTLNSYVHKAFAQGNDLHYDIEHERNKDEKAKMKAKLSKRNDGVIKAAKKLREEETVLSFDDFMKEQKACKKEELHPNQKKLDKNKNSKLDAHDFKLLRKEETEELDEATSPMQKLKDAHERHMQKALAANKAGDDEATKVHQVYMQKITAKMNKLKQNEEIDLAEMEELCEISKDTLKSYVKGAAQDLPRLGNTLGRLQTHGKLKGVEDKIAKSIHNRYHGINKATEKLTKEEVEQIEELDKKTLSSYVKKSHDQLMKHTSSVATKYARGDKDAMAYALDKTAVRKTANRTKGVDTALNKLSKEEAEQGALSERPLEPGEVHPELARGIAAGNREKAKHADQVKRGNAHLEKTKKQHSDFWNKKSKTNEEAIGTDHVNKDVKLKRAGAKGLGVMDKLKGIKHGFDAARKGESEDELKLYNKSKSTVKEETDMVTFKELLESISEAKIDDLKDKLAAQREKRLNAYDFSKEKDKKSNVTKVKGHSYGAGEEEGEDDDDTQKVSKPAKPEVKRGRGRPAGSKSGARN